MSCTQKELNTRVSECTYIDPTGLVKNMYMSRFSSCRLYVSSANTCRLSECLQHHLCSLSCPLDFTCNNQQICQHTSCNVKDRVKTFQLTFERQRRPCCKCFTPFSSDRAEFPPSDIVAVENPLIFSGNVTQLDQ